MPVTKKTAAKPAAAAKKPEAAVSKDAAAKPAASKAAVKPAASAKKEAKPKGNDAVLRIGIIGCGGIANGKHMPSLKKVKNVEMVAFCD
ncbi:MAG: hypothetical protein FWE70_02850, partial [Oscillospiraceae bacterium]|nr:hypothetical protein [Oscillospiraceae bacterium]